MRGVQTARSLRSAPPLRPKRAASGSPSSPFIRHKLRMQVEEWRKIGASAKVLDWIAKGVRLRWKRGPPRPFHRGISMVDLTPAQQAFMNTELGRLVQVGALEPGHSARFVSKAFLVPKGEGKWR